MPKNMKLAKLLAAQQRQAEHIKRLDPSWHPPTKMQELAAAMFPNNPSENEVRAREAKRKKGWG